MLLTDSGGDTISQQAGRSNHEDEVHRPHDGQAVHGRLRFLVRAPAVTRHALSADRGSNRNRGRYRGLDHCGHVSLQQTKEQKRVRWCLEVVCYGNVLL